MEVHVWAYFGDVRLALGRVIRSVFLEDDLCLGVGNLLDKLGKLDHGELCGVAHIEGACLRSIHDGHQPCIRHTKHELH